MSGSLEPYPSSTKVDRDMQDDTDACDYLGARIATNTEALTFLGHQRSLSLENPKRRFPIYGFGPNTASKLRRPLRDSTRCTFSVHLFGSAAPVPEDRSPTLDAFRLVSPGAHA